MDQNKAGTGPQQPVSGGPQPDPLKLQPAPGGTQPNQSKGGASISGDYDPHVHREVPDATNNFETLVHLLKCSLGTGILAMPQAFANSGLITGIVATVIIGIIITHCLHVLIRSQYMFCKRLHVPLLTYPASMTAALEVGPNFLRPLARLSATIVDIFLVVYQLGICCVYIVFISRNLKNLFDQYNELSIEVYMLIILLPLIIFNCIPNLKLLAPFSTFANVLTLVGIGIVVYYLLANEKSTEPLDLTGSITSFPLFFGTTLFALTSVGVVVALENNMKTPKAFGTPLGVLNVGMSTIVVLYVAMGSLGYIFCVSQCKDSITLNLSDSALTSTVLGMYVVAIFISYALHCYVPVEVVWHGYLKPRLELRGTTKLVVWEYGLRVTLCLLTFIFAVSIPRLGLFISLFGALCLSALGIIFPAILEICAYYPEIKGPRKKLFIKDIVLLVIGIVGLVAGTYTAILGIVASFKSTDTIAAANITTVKTTL